jgi:hypothetical protein
MGSRIRQSEVHMYTYAYTIYVYVLKETYYSVKRDLLQCQKRPTLRT